VAAIERRSEGTYAIEIPGGPAFLVVSVTWLDRLLRELRMAGMITADGRRLPPAP